jgi:pre-60S factor REI1
MKKNFGFFIIWEEFCVDKKGLIQYLAQKIHQKLLCIYCENKGSHNFKNGEAVQKHMIDKGHCFMNGDYFEEYD